jgi:translocation and assembly module TamA
MNPDYTQRPARLLSGLAALVLCVVALAVRSVPPPLEVQISGIPEKMSQAILASLPIEQDRTDARLTEAGIRRLHRQTPGEITRMLQAYGYYNATVTSSLARAGDGWRASYSVDLGPEVRVSSLDVQVLGPGKDDPVLMEWRKRYPLKPGDVLEHKLYEDAKNEVLQLSQERGYLDARFVLHEIRVDPQANKAEMRLHLESGERYRFGAVKLIQDTFDDAFVRGFLNFVPGEPYETSRLLALDQRFISSEYFAQARIRPLLDQTQDRAVPIEATLTPRKRTVYGFGLGYGTDTGPRISASAERRWVNRRGHRALGEVRASGIGSNLLLQYRIPAKHPATDYYAVVGTWTDEETDTADRQTATVTLSETKFLDPWERTLGLSYLNEFYDVGALTDQRSALLIPSMRWQRTKSDDPLYPSRGWHLAAELKGASEGLASDISMIQLAMDLKAVRRVSKRGRLIGRLDLGLSDVSDFDALPPSLRFFAGGDRSIRGYEYRSLGPVDSSGKVVGGRNLAVASLEYEHTLKKDIALALFYDVGNAFNGTLDAHAGAGVGLHWRLPVGMLRLDLAQALDDPDRPWRVHFTIGPDL